MARVPFMVIPGVPKADGAVLRVVAMNNAAVTWSCTGTGLSGTVSMSQFGTDRGTPDPGGQTFAGYVGTITISGLVGEGLKQYSVPVTQSGVTLTAGFRLKPKLGQKYQVALTTCFDTQDTQGATEALEFPHILDMADSDDPPMACWMNVDDLMYLDNANVDDTSGTGRKATGVPQTTLKQYDYAIGWMLRLGLLGFGISQADIRLLSKRNHAFMYGNHDLDAGFGFPTSTPFGPPANAYSATGTPNKDGAGATVYEQIFSHCRGDAFNAPLDTVASAWTLTLGGVKFVCPDPISSSTGGAWLGNNQIDDCLTALNSDEGIKFLLCQHPPKDVFDSVSGVSASKSPQDGVALSSTTRMFRTTSANPLNLSSNAKTNGTKGICIVTSGDQHTSHVYKAVAATEKFLVWCCGGTTSVGHNDGVDSGGVPIIVEGQTFNECGILYQCRNDTLHLGLDPRGSSQGWTRIKVFGDEYPLRVSMEHRRDSSINNSGPVITGFIRHFTASGLTDNYGATASVTRHLAKTISE